MRRGKRKEEEEWSTDERAEEDDHFGFHEDEEPLQRSTPVLSFPNPSTQAAGQGSKVNLC